MHNFISPELIGSGFEYQGFLLLYSLITVVVIKMVLFVEMSNTIDWVKNNLSIVW